MSQPPLSPREPADRDRARVAQELAGRLRALGVAVRDDDTPDGIVLMMEGVEAFERAVQARGGDLMMDEPPAHHRGEPDDPHFLLPTRADDETAAAYVARLDAATAALRRHKSHD